MMDVMSKLGGALRDEVSRKRYRAWALLALLLVLGACDLRVENPSKISDADLEDPLMIPALVTGAASDVGYAATIPGFGGLFVIGSVLTDELVATDTRVGPRSMSDGNVRNDLDEAQSWWAYAARARWTTESVVARAKRLLPDADTNILVARGALYAGFANRINGDAFCEAVIDGGPLEPHTTFFNRAEEYFTEAIAVGTAAGADSIVTAGHAGRAQVRMMLGKWDGAVEDAALVPNNFSINIHNSTAGRNLNRYWTYARDDSRYVVWGNPFFDWGVNWSGDRNVGDPRVVWEPFMEGTDYARGPDLRRPHIRQRKYTGTGTAIPYAKGTEMRLIEAEAELIKGDWQAAIDKINEVRDYRNSIAPSTWGTNRLELATATNLDEAWYELMRERGIELWLEGRRLADLRRWAVTPGKAKVPFTVVRRAAQSPNADDDPRVSVYDVNNALCFEVSLDERLSNPNIDGGK